MSAVVIEHVKVGDLPEAWRERLARPSDARVTVRIEDETGRQETAATRLTAGEAIEDLLTWLRLRAPQRGDRSESSGKLAKQKAEWRI